MAGDIKAPQKRKGRALAHIQSMQLIIMLGLMALFLSLLAFFSDPSRDFSTLFLGMFVMGIALVAVAIVGLISTYKRK
ncbi:MAG: hypothetical protein SA339_13535 [Methanomassiliicoccus sp.]|nr:hypothetical protein [Methanomassiliicoccus sp.]